MSGIITLAASSSDLTAIRTTVDIFILVFIIPVIIAILVIIFRVYRRFVRRNLKAKVLYRITCMRLSMLDRSRDCFWGGKIGTPLFLLSGLLLALSSGAVIV